MPSAFQPVELTDQPAAQSPRRPATAVRLAQAATVSCCILQAG